MIVWRPRHGTQAANLTFVGPVDIHRPNLGNRSACRELPPTDALSIWGKEGAAIVPKRRREPPHVIAIGVHDIDVVQIGRIELELFFLHSDNPL